MKAEEKKSEAYLIKWITIGCLGVLSIIVLFVLSLLWYFSPLISMDEGRVSFLGNLFTLDEKGANFFHSETISRWHEYDTHHEEGSYSLKKGDKKLKLIFSDVDARLVWTQNNSVSWECSSKKGGFFPAKLMEADEEGLVLSLDKPGTCSVEIPESIALFLKAESGKITVKEPLNSYNLNLTNGMISIRPHEKTPFHYELKVDNGVMGPFEGLHSQEKEAKKARIHLKNGTLLREH